MHFFLSDNVHEYLSVQMEQDGAVRVHLVADELARACSVGTASIQVKHNLVLTKKAAFAILKYGIMLLIIQLNCTTVYEIEVIHFFVVA